MHRLLTNIINNAKENITVDSSKDRDKMSVLEKLITKCGKDSQIPVVMAMDAMMAGIDTTGNTSTFLLYHLASNPDKQEILFQEINEKLGDRRLTPKLLGELKYLRATQQENQRMFPVAGGLGRLTQQDIVCSGFKIPKGTRVIFAFPEVHRNHFEDAEKFMPERFLRGCPSQHSAHPYAYIPFGHGPRMCIGRRFAELEMQILMIETLRSVCIGQIIFLLQFQNHII